MVGHLRDRGYVTVADSPTSKREKSVILTSRGSDYLKAQRMAARRIEDELRVEFGDAAISGLFALLDALGHGKQTRLRSYLQRSARI